MLQEMSSDQSEYLFRMWAHADGNCKLVNAYGESAEGRYGTNQRNENGLLLTKTAADQLAVTGTMGMGMVTGEPVTAVADSKVRPKTF